MDAYCKRCGDKFTVPTETVELIEQGFISGIQYIETAECSHCDTNIAINDSYDDHSDADNGL